MEILNNELQFKDFDSVCRFCLNRDTLLNPIFPQKHEESVNYDHIINIDVNSIAAADETTCNNDRKDALTLIISICTNLEINQMDELPKLICTTCLNQLVISYTFRQQCLTSNRRLEEIKEAYNSKKSILIANSQNLIENDSTVLEEKFNIFSDSIDSDGVDRKDIIDSFSGNEFYSSDIEPIGKKRKENPNKKIRKNKIKRSKADKLKVQKEKKKKHIDDTKPKKKYKRSKRTDICSLCGKQTKNIHTHMGQHTVGKSFECDICGAVLKTIEILKKHMRFVHSEIRRYPCTVCNTSYKTSTHLKRHLLSHSKDRVYPCNFCHLKFIDAGTRDRHIPVHSQERKVKCQYCEKLFLTAIGLKNHIGIHTGERLFQCGLCPMTFINTSSASKHRITSHTIDSFYKCGSCDAAYQQLTLLKVHIRQENHKFLNYS